MNVLFFEQNVHLYQFALGAIRNLFIQNVPCDLMTDATVVRSFSAVKGLTRKALVFRSLMSSFCWSVKPLAAMILSSGFNFRSARIVAAPSIKGIAISVITRSISF